MILSTRTGLAGFFILAATVLSACGSSSIGDPVLDADGSPDVTVDDPTNSGPDTGTDTTTNPDTGTPATPGDTQSGVPDDAAPNTPVDSPQQGADDPAESLADPVVTGSDQSGAEDDSPTAAESASLVGPFIKDPSRGAGPPSAPQNLTLLLSSEEWIEFTWEPSTDDQSVEAYEVYRDGTLLATINHDSEYEHDYRSWLSTSFIDCNYTRYTYCEGNQPVPGSSYSYTVVAVDNEGMRSAHSSAAVFSFEQLGNSSVDTNGYTKVFSEEFDGTSLDRTRWKTALPWGPNRIINGETQYFVNIFGNNPPAYDPFVFTGDTLQITGTETPAELLGAANNQPYLSGVITTSDYFEMTYGYVEMSAKVAGGQGLLSTFYLFNQDYEKNQPEIDILEYIGSRPDKAYQTYHYYDSQRARFPSGEKHSSPTMETAAGQNLSSGFHTYGVLWEKGLVVWFIDGQEVRRLTGPRVSDEPMNIIAQLVVGSNWIGAPAAGVIPAVFEIDYIRAWQKQ